MSLHISIGGTKANNNVNVEALKKLESGLSKNPKAGEKQVVVEGHINEKSLFEVEMNYEGGVQTMELAWPTNLGTTGHGSAGHPEVTQLCSYGFAGCFLWTFMNNQCLMSDGAVNAASCRVEQDIDFGTGDVKEVRVAVYADVGDKEAAQEAQLRAFDRCPASNMAGRSHRVSVVVTKTKSPAPPKNDAGKQRIEITKRELPGGQGAGTLSNTVAWNVVDSSKTQMEAPGDSCALAPAFHTDAPSAMGGRGRAPNPVVWCLSGIIGMLAFEYAAALSAKDIAVHGIAARISLKQNVRRVVLGEDTPVFSEIEITLQVDSPAAHSVLNAIAQETAGRTPSVVAMERAVPVRHQLYLRREEARSSGDVSVRVSSQKGHVELAPACSKTFFCCLDGGELGLSALQNTLPMVSDIDRIVLYSVFPTGKLPAEQRQARFAEARAVIDKCKRSDECKVPPSVTEEWEQAAKASVGRSILKASVEHSADYVVMGARHSTTVLGKLLGSVSKYVMRHSLVPVLISSDVGAPPAEYKLDSKRVHLDAIPATLTVQDLLPPNKQLVSVRTDTKWLDVLHTLVEANVHSCPIFNVENVVCGSVDLYDLLTVALNVYTEQQLLSLTHGDELLDRLTAGWLSNSSARNGLKTVSSSIPFRAVVTALSHDVRRLIVLHPDSPSRVVGVLSTNQVMRYLSAHREHLSLDRKVDSWAVKPITSCSASDSAHDAFRKMSEARVTALPIVDAFGHLIGTLSSSDIKYVEPSELFTHLFGTVGSFKDKVMQKRGYRGKLIAQLGDSYQEILTRFSDSGMGRLWLVDKEMKVTGVVSVTHFIQKLFEQ